MIFRSILIAGSVLGAFTSVSDPAVAVPPTRPDDVVAAEIRDQMIASYDKTNTYQAEATLRIVSQQGRWTTQQTTTMKVARDRASNRLLIDLPDTLMVIDGGKLRYRIQGQPHYVEIDAPEETDLSSLNQVVPMPIRILSPDAFTLLDDAWRTDIESKSIRQVSGGVDDPRGLQGLRFRYEEGTMTLWMNPDDHLITTARFESDPQSPNRLEAPYTLDYQIDVTAHNQPLDDAVFAFDTTDLERHESLESLQQGLQGGPPQEALDESVSLQGHEAPEIVLETLSGEPFDLDKVEADVIVLDFWATWCPPCRRGLPMLQAFHEWVQANDKSVAVYTVNLQEKPKVVREYWEKEGFTLPVLMDVDGKVASAYQVQSIPQTVIITHGQVVQTHVGLIPDLEETLRAEVQEILDRIEDPDETDSE